MVNFNNLFKNYFQYGQYDTETAGAPKEGKKPQKAEANTPTGIKNDVPGGCPKGKPGCTHCGGCGKDHAKGGKANFIG